MIGLILGGLLAVIFSYFALQNNQVVDLTFLNYGASVPVYLVAILSLLVGVFLSLIFATANSISSGLAMFGKDQHIRGAENEIDRLKKKIDDIKLENARLSGARANRPVLQQSPLARPNFFQKFRERMSV